jgi:hypothetical protein
MALAFYFAPNPPMSAAQYRECLKLLKKAGAGHPRGRLYHASFGSPESVAVFDVWTSQAAFDAFGKTLMPILQQMGADPGQPHVMPVHNVIVPPAAKKAAPRSKAAARKRAAAPKGKIKRAARKR